MIVLGIETSCDETGLAIYDTNQGLRAHALHSQIAIHALYGGVVPELASRDHTRHLLPLLENVLEKSKVSLADLDVIAYTQGPGLAGALLVGAGFAASLGLALDKPILGIHHLKGHFLIALLSENPPAFPFVVLLVSGGHTQLLCVEDVDSAYILGETLDDAAGEAFDKTAQLLGLGYPGGAILSEWATRGNPGVYDLPRPMLRTKSLDMSFSGLKTAVLCLVKKHSQGVTDQKKADIARAFVDAMVEVLTTKCLAALEKTGLKSLVIAGGVSANIALRNSLKNHAKNHGFNLHYPPLDFCTDNGAMIAFAAALYLQKNPQYAQHAYAFSVRPRWPLPRQTQNLSTEKF